MSERPFPKRRETAVPVVLLAAAVVWAALWAFATRELWSQGGYLHLAFAQTLAANRGYGAGGRAAFGDAAPLWVALLAGVHQLLHGFTTDWVVAGKVTAALAVVFFLAGLYRLSQALLAGADERRRRAAPAAVVLVTVLSPFWGPVAFSGSEVLAAAGVACWSCALVAGRFTAPLRPLRLLAACLCAGCGPLLRPEMLALSLCLAPFLFVRWVNTPLGFRRRVALFFGGLLLAVGPGAWWLLYTVRVFGTALPNTLGVAAAAPGVSVLGQALLRFAVGAPWLPLALAGLLGWAFLWFKQRRRDVLTSPVAHSGWPGEIRGELDPALWIPLAWTCLALLFYLATHTAITPEHVLLLSPACTASLLAGLSSRRPRFVGRAAACCAGYGLALSLLLGGRTLAVERQQQQLYAELAGVVQRLPATERVALTPVGEVLLLSGRPVVDLGGLLDPAAQDFRWDPADGRRVWWAHGQGARLMLLDHPPEPGSHAIWTRDLPANPSASVWNTAGVFGQFDRLSLWSLPPSPTLPAPEASPEGEH